MHTTADDPKKYRTEQEEKEWWEKDPLKRFKLYLEKKHVLDEQLQAQIDTDVKKYIDDEIKAFESQTEFKPDTLFDHVFGTTHAEIERQRAEFLANLKLGATHA